MKEEWRGNGSWEGGQMSVPWGGKVAADCGRREEGRKQDGWVRPVDGSSWRQGMKSGGSQGMFPSARTIQGESTSSHVPWPGFILMGISSQASWETIG